MEEADKKKREEEEAAALAAATANKAASDLSSESTTVTGPGGPGVSEKKVTESESKTSEPAAVVVSKEKGKDNMWAGRCRSLRLAGWRHQANLHQAQKRFGVLVKFLYDYVQVFTCLRTRGVSPQNEVRRVHKFKALHF